MKINLLLFTQIVPIFITPPSFLKFHFPLIQFFFLTSLSLETSFTFLLELECWQQTDIILLHLRISFISFHSWRIFSLNIEFWLFSCFLPAFLGMVHGFWWKVISFKLLPMSGFFNLSTLDRIISCCGVLSHLS